MLRAPPRHIKWKYVEPKIPEATTKMAPRMRVSCIDTYIYYIYIYCILYMPDCQVWPTCMRIHIYVYTAQDTADLYLLRLNRLKAWIFECLWLKPALLALLRPKYKQCSSPPFIILLKYLWINSVVCLCTKGNTLLSY